MMDQEGAPLAADKTTEYRLPADVVPERYAISLTPDLRAFTFAGEEDVTVRVLAATAEVVLNALELEIDRVSATRGGVTVAGKAALEPAHERARFTFERALEPGEWTLRIVAQHNDAIVVNHRRTSEAPADAVLAHVDRPQIAIP